MTNNTIEELKVPQRFQDLQDDAMAARLDLLKRRAAMTADMPLKYWNQQAQFTTPASGTPEKAIRGLKPTRKILDRFGISLENIAEHGNVPLEALEAVALSGDDHSPFVMVDVEDAVALTEDSIRKARLGAVRSFTQEDWGHTLPFFRPGGLRLNSCVEDLLTVVPAAAEAGGTDPLPIAGIVWPKTEHPDELSWVCDLLTGIEDRLVLPENSIKLEFLVESAYGLAQVTELARACMPRLAGIIWGIADYSADVNLPRIQNDHPVSDWARFEIVNIAGAAGVPAIDNMTLNYPTPAHRGADLSEEQRRENKVKILGALKEVYDDALHGIELGMTGKWVGHPLQLLMVMAAYRDAIPDAQVERDIKEIDAYQSSVDAGAGATMLGEGKAEYMADRATDRHLRARLRRATAWGKVTPDKAQKMGVISGAEAQELQG